MNLSVHIERLVLDGAVLGGAQPHLLQAAIQVELARLLGEGALAPALAQAGAVARLSGPGFEMPQGGGAAHAGMQIAAAVYGGIGT